MDVAVPPSKIYCSMKLTNNVKVSIYAAISSEPCLMENRSVVQQLSERQGVWTMIRSYVNKRLTSEGYIREDRALFSILGGLTRLAPGQTLDFFVAAEGIAYVTVITDHLYGEALRTFVIADDFPTRPGTNFVVENYCLKIVNS
ncbi:unnamed protein product [Caenorhabditis auriculariae]|uniref:Uncharacterized protein n=1 Tax=Caenorhabditis auriculariae TaxID=2777116 RepID=A0A8S1HSW8_9PELO|nr:unnamed protein product [Caenorhabditis auriculariae]